MKLLVWLATPDQDLPDRAVNLLLIALAAVSFYRVANAARSGVLWRVSRKLVLSYLLVGAVPILLLVTFSILAILLICFDVSSYLVRTRVAALTEHAGVLAQTTLDEIEAAGDRKRIVARHASAAAARFAGATISTIAVDELPQWLKGRRFDGLVMRGGEVVVRSVAVPSGMPGRDGVVVDIPADPSIPGQSLTTAGVTLGPARRQSLLNTAMLLTHTNWENGQVVRTAVPMSVDVLSLYRFLGGSQAGVLVALISIAVLLLVIEAVALGNGLALARSITAAVDDLFKGTERVASGEFGHPIPVRADDQLGRLATSFNEMTSRIKELLVEQGEKRRLAEELRIARDIQMSLLPQGPFSLPGLSMAGMCTPAREVGGDYYDVLPLPGGCVGLLIADVSGKGTSAALYMAELKGLMLSLSRIYASPRALLIEANSIIAQHLDSRSFITMTYVVLDPAARTLTCARAGHCPFLRIPAGPAGRRRAELLAPEGMVLGLNLDNGERFERCLAEISMPLAVGDLYCFFTDGISEAMDDKGDCYGESRMTTLLEAHADLSAEALRDRLLDEVMRFAGAQPQHDDITMIMLKVEEPDFGRMHG